MKRPRGGSRCPSAEEKPSASMELPLLEATVVKILLMNPFFAETLLEHEDLIESSFGRKIMNTGIRSSYGTKGDFHKEEILDRLEPGGKSAAFAAAGSNPDCRQRGAGLCRMSAKKAYSKLQEQERELIDRLSLADENADGDTVRQLTRELMEVQDKMKAHGGTNS